MADRLFIPEFNPRPPHMVDLRLSERRTPADNFCLTVPTALFRIRLTSKERVLVAEVFSAVGLPEAHDTCRIQAPRFGRTPRSLIPCQDSLDTTKKKRGEGTINIRRQSQAGYLPCCTPHSLDARGSPQTTAQRAP